MIWGERIRLKRLELDDIKKMMNWGENEELLFADYNFPQLSESEQKLWYGRKNQHGRKCYSIFNKENRLIGYIALRKLNYIDKSGEIGIVIDPNYHNMNYGTEAITLFLNWFFYDFKFHKKSFLNIIKSYHLFEEICEAKDYIHTIRGYGYRFDGSYNHFDS